MVAMVDAGMVDGGDDGRVAMVDGCRWWMGVNGGCLAMVDGW